MNTEGSYLCECNQLLWSVFGANGYLCKDYNKCSNDTHNDSDEANAECIDEQGAYSCECHDDYRVTNDDG